MGGPKKKVIKFYNFVDFQTSFTGTAV